MNRVRHSFNRYVKTKFRLSFSAQTHVFPDRSNQVVDSVEAVHDVRSGNVEVRVADSARLSTRISPVMRFHPNNH